jgi:hypothetical protein
MSIFKKHTLLLASMLSIVVISLFSSKIVPIYDGVGFPDEPYRYSKPPASQKKATLPPSPAEVSVDIKNNTNQSDVGLASKEQGPQVNIYVYRLALNAKSSSDKISLKAQPIAPESIKTSKGNIAGNAYHLSAVSNNGAVIFNSGKKGYIDLRVPQGFYAPVKMVYRTKSNETWQPIETSRVGNDIYEASIVGFGDYALVPPTVKNTSGTHSPLFIIGILIALLIILITVLLIFGRRHNKTHKHKKLK